MVTCKFTKTELQLMRAGIKVLSNCHKEIAKDILNENINSLSCEKLNDNEVSIECGRLIGIIDSLYRNNL